MNANELADELERLNKMSLFDFDAAFDRKKADEMVNMLRQQQAEIEALKKRVEEVKATNGQLVDLVQLQREDAEKMRNEILAWENAEVPVEVMADIVEELERRGFITK